jgi:4-hydroxybenzoate polyprenyltransferase
MKRNSSIIRFRLFLRSLIKLTRVGNLLIIAIAQFFIAGFVVNGNTLLDISLWILVTSTVLIAAGGYIINDYYDVKIDYVNKPHRVVIGKDIARRQAILFHVVLSVLGIGMGALLGLKIAAIHVFSVLLLWWYSNSLKRLTLVGNIAVAFLTGLSIYAIEVLYKTGNLSIMLYAVFAFFMTLIREIIKDIEDMKGDTTFGCKTLPIVYGIRKTKWILYGLILLFSIVVMVVNMIYDPLPFSYYILFLYVPLAFVVFKLIRADTTKDFHKLSNLCKIIMLLGILSLAFLS